MTNIQNFTASTDWLQINFHGKFVYEVGKTHQIAQSLYVKTLKKTSRNFAHISEVYFEKKKIGVIQHTPYDGSVLHEDMIIFKMENQLNYETGFIDTIKRMAKTANWKYKNITRLDVCTDGKGFLRPMELIRKGVIENVGRADVQDLTKFVDGKRTLVQSTIGKRGSELFVTIYRKDVELEKSQKGYIKQFYKKNGVTDEQYKGLERFEIRMKGDRLRKMVFPKESEFSGEFCFPTNDIDSLDKLENTEFLYNLIESNSKVHYQFVKVKDLETETNISRIKRVFKLSLIKKATALLEKAVIVGKKSTAWAKNLCKHSYMMYKSSKNNIHLYTMRELVDYFELSVWLQKRLDDWDYEHKHLLKNENGKSWNRTMQFVGKGKQQRIAEYNLAPIKTW